MEMARNLKKKQHLAPSFKSNQKYKELSLGYIFTNDFGKNVYLGYHCLIGRLLTMYHCTNANFFSHRLRIKQMMQEDPPSSFVSQLVQFTIHWKYCRTIRQLPPISVPSSVDSLTSGWMCFIKQLHSLVLSQFPNVCYVCRIVDEVKVKKGTLLNPLSAVLT